MRVGYYFWILIFLCLGLCAIITWDFIHTHEQLHQNVFSNYVIDSKVEYGLTEATTTPVNTSEYFEKCNERCKDLQQMVEIVGYNTQFILDIIIFFGLVIVSLLTGLLITVVLK